MTHNVVGHVPSLHYCCAMPPTGSSSNQPLRRASDATALRLGRVILGYLAVITLIITLAPFRFATWPVHGLTDAWTWSDIVMNVLMFVPFGFVYQLTRPARSPVRWPQALLMGAALSGAIEFAQLFEASRFSSLIDVATNAAGAGLGAWLFTAIVWRIEGARAVRTLALELPLMGLVYLLIPLIWLLGLGSAGGTRMWLVLPVLVFGGGILGTVHAAYVSPRVLPAPSAGVDEPEAAGNAQHWQPRSRAWLLLVVAVWYAIALLPAAIRDRDVLLAGLVITLGVAWLRSLATGRYRTADATRRFELPTLRLVLPLFATYLALSSLWPLTGADGSFEFMLALLPTHDAIKAEIFVALEHVAAFTLVGYIVAEFYGRDVPRYRGIAARVLLWGCGLSVLLEIARGFHPAYRASALMLLFTVVAAMFGGWLYQLQREHVKALITRRR